MPHRILLVFAWARILLRGEHRHLPFTRIDRWLLLFTGWSALAYILLWGNLAAVANRLGFVFNVVGLYFLFRVLIRSREDFEHVISWVARATVLMAGCMLIEFTTQKNPLAVFGHIEPEVQNRFGRLRCQAAFGHPISAGAFGATLLPLWIACWWQEGKLRKWAILGATASTIITGTAGSSTPLGAYLAAWLGFGLWYYRQHLPMLRWMVLFALLGLHFVMKAPVWALIARIDFTSGNSGYHRFKLVDSFVRHFGEWWLLGVKSTADWGWMMDDIANQFLAYGSKGGFLGLILFVALLTACFREVGRLVRSTTLDRPTGLLLWSFGAMLFSHCVIFLGFSYWDQIIVPWYLLLAMFASLRFFEPAEKTEPVADLPAEPAGDLFSAAADPMTGPAWDYSCRPGGEGRPAAR
jgi:hypothetical protein